jgi:hypothetical protein
MTGMPQVISNVFGALESLALGSAVATSLNRTHVTADAQVGCLRIECFSAKDCTSSGMTHESVWKANPKRSTSSTGRQAMGRIGKLPFRSGPLNVLLYTEREVYAPASS